MSAPLGVVLTRPDPPLTPNLDINDRISYRFDIFAFELGPIRHRRVREISDQVRGGVLVSAVQDVRSIHGEVVVFGTDTDNLELRVGVLRDALLQWTYELQITTAASLRRFVMERADVDVDVARLIRGRLQTLVTFDSWATTTTESF